VANDTRTLESQCEESAQASTLDCMHSPSVDELSQLQSQLSSIPDTHCTTTSGYFVHFTIFYYCYYYYYICLTAFFPGNRHQRGKPFSILLEQEMMGGNGVSWTICKSFAPCCRQITTKVPHHSVFTGQMPFLPPNQQCKSTEGKQGTEDKTLYHLLIVF